MPTTEQRTRLPGPALRLVVTVQFALAGYAWVDLARRPGELVRGPKPAWALVIAINFVGPITYLLFGRIRSCAGSTSSPPCQQPFDDDRGGGDAHGRQDHVGVTRVHSEEPLGHRHE